MTWAIEKKGYSQRRAYGLIGLKPKTYRYASTRPDHAGLRARLRALAAERRRFGYRRPHILLRRCQRRGRCAIDQSIAALVPGGEIALMGLFEQAGTPPDFISL